MSSDGGGGELFIVDNSISGWTGLREAGYEARNYVGSWHAWARAVPGDP